MRPETKYSEKLIKLLPYPVIEWLAKADRTVDRQVKRLKSTTPSFLEWMAQKRLLSAFHKAARRVPHYREYLASKDVDVGSVKTVQDLLRFVPPVDKTSYIQTCDSPGVLCVDGRIEAASLLTRSSGFSGKPCTWPKSRAEEKESQMEVAVFLECYFGISRYRTLVINSYLLGTWTSGITVTRLMPGNVSLVVTGPKTEEILEIIMQFKSEYDQILILGYPPFLKMLVDKGMERDAGFWSGQDARFVLLSGGEGFSEGWRDYMNRCLGEQGGSDPDGRVFSAYGAADVSLVGFTETFDSIRIRRMARSNREFASALFGDDFGAVPMLFSYNPWKFYVTANDKGELEFSTISPNTLAPLIRYNLHDRGGTISYRRMQARLRSFGFDPSIDWPFPFLYVSGRSTGEVSVGGQLIFPENVKEALFANHDIASQISGRFKMVTEEDAESNAGFYVDVELKNGVAINEQLAAECQKVIHDHLSRSSLDYREVVKSMPAAKVRVRLRREGELENRRDIKIHYT